VIIMAEKNKILLQGNEACVLGAIRAGMKFYAGYPITPSSEIAEKAAELLPKHGGKFIQMEDEIAGIACAIGGSLAGLKSMTATSGPGFSLKQENLGYACIAEIPLVVVNIMRMGPSTGLPTSPAQGDLMQAKWGTHGDHPVICYYPSSVREMYEYTIKAFNMAEKFRTPVLVMTDEVIAHMRAGVEIPEEVEIIDRKKPEWGKSYLPFKVTDGEEIAPLAAFGSGFRFHVTGLAHDEMGFPSNNPLRNDEMIRHICAKVDKCNDEIVESAEHFTDDAEVLFVACGSVARTALYVVKQMRSEGVKAGLLIPKTVWPFPEKALKALSSRIHKIIVPEMNMGQLVYEVERIVKGDSTVTLLEKVTGELFKTEEMYNKAMAVIKQ